MRFRRNFQYNYFCEFNGISDTIRLQKNGVDLSTTYKGHDVSRIAKDGIFEAQGLKIVDYSGANNVRFESETLLANGRKRILKYFKYCSSSKNCHVREDEGLAFYYTFDGEKIGQYKFYNPTKRLRRIGEYCQVDSIFSDTFLVQHPNDIRPYLEVKQFNKLSYKCGNWEIND